MSENIPNRKARKIMIRNALEKMYDLTDEYGAIDPLKVQKAISELVIKLGHEEKLVLEALKDLGIAPSLESKEKILGVYSDEDLMNYIPTQQQWLIENQIPAQEIGLIVGKRGERKTFTTLYQVVSLACGKKVFNDPAPTPKRILVIDEESGKDEIAKRINSIKKGIGIEKETLQIKFVSFEGLKLDTESKKSRALWELIENFKPDLIVVDCLARVVSFDINKDNSATSEFFTTKIRPATKKYGCTWLFIHHLRKSPPMKYNPEDMLDEVRGASELTNYCRFVLLCQSPKNQTKNGDGSELLIFRALKMSNVQIPEPKVISFSHEKDIVRVQYEGVPEEVLASEIKCAEAIKKLLFEEQITGEFSTKFIKEQSDRIGFKKSLIQQALTALVKDGTLKKEKRGKYRISGGDQQLVQ